MRDPNAKLPRKVGGRTAPEEVDSKAPATKRPPIPMELIDAMTPDGAPDLKELEKRGLLPKYLRLWNNPATQKQLKTVSQLMKADGIELTDKTAKRAWAGKNQAKLEPDEEKQEPAEKKEPFRNPGASVGRNDPCPCGSGKKFKKCCAGK